MRSPKAPGNLRDFHIDERSPFSGASLGDVAPAQNVAPPPPPPPRQSLRTRQTEVEEDWAAPASNSGISETNSLDSLWTSWEQDAGGVDLSKAVPASPAPSSRESISTPRSSTLSSPPVRSSKAPAASAVSASVAAPVGVVTEGQARTEPLAGHLPWSADLAHNERRMERTGTVDYTNQFQKQEVLRSRTREFTSLLQKQFREQVEVFNDARHSPAHQIHVYKVSKSDEDFMLYRNGVKLVVSGSRAGRVIFAFNQYLGQIYAPTQSPVLEIEASWGPFDQLFWSYKGERVQIMDLVRYFLTEFVRQSFR